MLVCSSPPATPQPRFSLSARTGTAHQRHGGANGRLLPRRLHALVWPLQDPCSPVQPSGDAGRRVSVGKRRQADDDGEACARSCRQHRCRSPPPPVGVRHADLSRRRDDSVLPALVRGMGSRGAPGAPARRAPHRAVRLTAPTQVPTCLDVLEECCSDHKAGYLRRSAEDGQGNGAGTVTRHTSCGCQSGGLARPISGSTAFRAIFIASKTEYLAQNAPVAAAEQGLSPW